MVKSVSQSRQRQNRVQQFRIFEFIGPIASSTLSAQLHMPRLHRHMQHNIQHPVDNMEFAPIGVSRLHSSSHLAVWVYSSHVASHVTVLHMQVATAAAAAVSRVSVEGGRS